MTSANASRLLSRDMWLLSGGSEMARMDYRGASTQASPEGKRPGSSPGLAGLFLLLALIVGLLAVVAG